jgi:hypothetical protein
VDDPPGTRRPAGPVRRALLRFSPGIGASMPGVHH